MAKFRAKVTSKGQITIPLEVRKGLGIRPGEHAKFDTGSPPTVIRPVRSDENPFEKWRGIATGAFPGGISEINAWIREMRGRDEDSD
jgi:AbrB family looped-hinge helix DNA binding protein